MSRFRRTNIKHRKVPSNSEEADLAHENDEEQPLLDQKEDKVVTHDIASDNESISGSEVSGKHTRKTTETAKTSDSKASIPGGPPIEYDPDMPFEEKFVITGNPRADLKRWATMPWLDPPFSYSVTGVKFSDAWTYFLLLGGAETISTMVSEVSIDVDGDGDVSPEEMKAQEDYCQRLIDQSLNFMINAGVIGALILSVLYPVVLTPLPFSERSAEFFGKETMVVFEYFYYICSYACLFLSLWITYKSMHCYAHLSIWMCTLELKMWYITELSILPDINIVSHASVIMLGLALPPGIILVVGPEPGGVAGLLELALIISLIYASFSSSGGDTDLVEEIHRKMRKMFRIPDDKVKEV